MLSSILVRKQQKSVLAVLAVLAMIIYIRLEQHLFNFCVQSPESVPVDKHVVDKHVVELTETDQAIPFIKVTTVDHTIGSQKNVFTNTRLKNTPIEDTLLIVASIANVKSFGNSRTFKDYMDVIAGIDYDKSKINLAFFCGTGELFEQVNAFTENLFASQADVKYGKVTVLKAEFLKSEFSSFEHDVKVQRPRRRLIARARNYALMNSLDSEQYTLFMDADIIRLDNVDMVRRFVASGKDIVVPRVEIGFNNDYDRNSWRGEPVTPSAEQQALMDQNKWDDVVFITHDKPGLFHLGLHVEETKNANPGDPALSLDHLVPLDSVGGAILFAKSIIYKQGILFPPLCIVGTTWGRHEGFDGMETEGLCYIARVAGYSCWGMPNLVAQHAV